MLKKSRNSLRFLHNLEISFSIFYEVQQTERSPIIRLVSTKHHQSVIHCDKKEAWGHSFSPALENLLCISNSNVCIA